MIQRTLLALAFGASPLASQTPPCASLNDRNANVANLVTLRNNATPNKWGWRFVPSSTVVASGMRIFTHNKPSTGFMRLEIWDQSSTSNFPGKRLADGTWYAPKSMLPSWQGANLDRPVMLLKGKPYWFVWVEDGYSKLPVERAGTKMSAAALWNGSWWQPSSWTELKWRLYCTLLDTKGTQVFGSPCAGASGSVGTAFSNQEPQIGNADFRIEGTGLPAGAPALFLIGTNWSFQSVRLGAVAPNCFLNTNLALLLPGMTGAGDIRATAAAGHLYLPFPIPSANSLRGVFFALQVAAFDASSSNILKLAFTNAVRVTLF